ncbi:C4-dicarboxylate transporter/malic acid transport protein [Rhizobium sp. BK529]|uniref:TDT family transporter n=1 Tax=unclassified Rhizobium TaxID=2613769 RepID=UPI0010532115|nr:MULTISPECIES: TDT family transporter [unclassified Rhizobium]MBB3595596.1 C4-dicarboxylate transporter/malic acid transport protein [Rhizobium sp. BK529]TCS00614.1 C4-dicarboxylate transporter/malic acid transport protein [Rhizobium sp. BK418]
MTVLPLSPSVPIARPQARVLRHFTPNWFATTMGTGILAVCLGQFPDLPMVRAAGEVLWLANMGLFIVLTCTYAGKWLLHPGAALRAFDHPVVSMFFGCIPMGLATIINGFLIFGPSLFGAAAVAIAAELWWVDAALAVLAGLAIPLVMFTRQQHAIEHMSAIWLLPIVASEVAAASGGLLVPHLATGEQLPVLFASFVLWSCSVPLALGILVILFLRMALHKLPPAGMAATSFLALGPIGTGALGLALFAINGGQALTAGGLGALVPAISGAAVFGAVLLWGYGLWWLGLAVGITINHLRQGLPFNLGWWGYTFPIGVYAVATLRLSSIFPLPALTGFGEILVAALAAIWIVVAIRTSRGAYNGSLFVDPSLEN